MTPRAVPSSSAYCKERPARIIGKNLCLSLYQNMVLVKEFEALLGDRWLNREYSRSIFPCRGQEACGIGVSRALGTSDWLLLPFRCLHYVIGRGVPLERVAAEVYGLESGCGGGEWVRYVSPEQGIRGYFENVGANFSITVGLGLASSRLRRMNACICPFGDGAVSRGSFHSALNLSKVWNLPVLWICENNQMSISTPLSSLLANPSVADFSKGYGIPSTRIDGNDVGEVYCAVKKALEWVRRGRGPYLLELWTYRVGPHVIGDDQSYQPQQEIKLWKRFDPIKRFGATLMRLNWMNADEADRIQEENRRKAENVLDSLKARK